MPDTENFKNYKEFLVMCIIIKFCSFEHVEVECN